LQDSFFDKIVIDNESTPAEPQTSADDEAPDSTVSEGVLTEGAGRPDKRKAIVEAASLTFLERGFGDTSMDEVAARANVSKRTVYSHFGSKEALFKGIIENRCACIAQPTLGRELADLDIEAALVAIGLQFMDIVLSPEARTVERIIIGESNRFPDLGRIFYEAGPAEVSARVSAFLAERSDQGDLDIDDPDKAAACFLMMVQGKICKTAQMVPGWAPEPSDVEDMVRFAVRLFLGGAKAD